MSIEIQELPSVTDLENDQKSKEVLQKPITEWKETRARLSPSERSVWLLLQYGRGKIIPFERLENFIYKNKETRSKKDSQRLILRVTISHIRKKLKANIVCMAKLGYVLDPEEL